MSISPTTATNQFWVGNHLYELNIGIFDGYCRNAMMDTQRINMFSYDNRMNRLYTTGFIEYTDNSAEMDKFLESDAAYVTVSFSKLETKTSGTLRITESTSFTNLKFLIDSADILSNQPGEIKYRFNLVSPSYVAMSKDSRYTTYGDKKVSPTTIIQDILKNNIGLGVNSDSFETNMSPSLIHYITNNNDDGYSSIKYLLNKTVYYPNSSDKTLKSLVYDDNSDVVFLIDNRPDAKKLGTYNPIEIKVVKNSQFPGYQSPTYIGYTNNFSKSRAIVDTQDLKFYEYNIETNEFGNSLLNQQQIKNIINGGSENKAPMLTGTLSEGYGRYEMKWNNNIDLYTTAFRTLTQTNGLIVNQDGMLGAIPGFSCQVSIPNKFPILNNKTTTVQEESSQFQTITGIWDIFEVEHFISPNEGLFRQKLILYRNRVVS